MLDTSKIYKSTRSGGFKIIRHTSKERVLIEFINTGCQSIVYLHQAKMGSVKDRLKPSVLGVGFIGNGKYKSSIKGRHTKTYKTWMGMLSRCYCHKHQERQPTYKGCSVSPIWHNFQNFAKWFDNNYIDGLELDKDIKVKGNRIYSPNTCLFVNAADNTIKATAKHYTFISPNGEVVNIYNMSEFCRNNELQQTSMIAVNKGKSNHHKGWAKAQT